MTLPEKERLAVVETKVDTVIEAVKALGAKIDNLDSKYAAKWVQTAVAFVVGLIVSAVLVALIALVVIPKAKDGTTTAQNPSTSQTTTTTTPTGSTSTTKNSGSTGTSTPATANASANADATKPSDSQSSNGGLQITLPKVP